MYLHTSEALFMGEYLEYMKTHVVGIHLTYQIGYAVKLSAHLNAKLVGIHLTYQIGYAVILSAHLNAKLPLKIYSIRHLQILLLL